MPYFYHASLTPDAAELQFPPEEARHIRRVFRTREGTQISVTNGAGLLALASVEYRNGEVWCRIQKVWEMPCRTRQRITIAFSIIRPNRMDWAVEKLTELGVTTIQPLRCRYTTIRTFKTDHLRKVAISAMKQSEQTYLPQIQPPMELSHWLDSRQVSTIPRRYLAHLSENAMPFIRQFPSSGVEAVIAIGPEGGFSEAEIEQLVAREFIPVKLSAHILRTETAAVIAAGYLTCPSTET